MIKRNLLEKVFSKYDCGDEVDTMISWCEQHGTFSHSEASEFIFWIPSFDEYQTALDRSYGESIPDLIKDALVQAVHTQASEFDAGYLLLVFI